MTQMVNESITTYSANTCSERKDYCINCHSHFLSVRPHLTSVVVTKRFSKDLKDAEEVRSIWKAILDCSATDFIELHKFEKHVDGNAIFRAKKQGIHIVYSVDKHKRIIFLRAFKSYNEYEKFLDDKKEIKNLLIHA
jgi:mRNA-degrading endonuclease RelE of RelBE toxin-antitoxin system